MFEFSCEDCPAYGNQIAFSFCVKEGACWMGSERELSPVETIMREMRLGVTDITEQPSLFVKDGDIVRGAVQLTQQGKIVFNLAHYLAMQRRRARLCSLGIEDRCPFGGG